MADSVTRGDFGKAFLAKTLSTAKLARVLGCDEWDGCCQRGKGCGPQNRGLRYGFGFCGLPIDSAYALRIEPNPSLAFRVRWVRCPFHLGKKNLRRLRGALLVRPQWSHLNRAEGES